MSHNNHLKIIAFSLLYIPVSHAAEWSVTGNLNSSIDYNDNLLMVEKNKDAVFRTVLVPQLTLKRQLEDSNITFDAGYRIIRHSSLKNLDNQNPFLNLNSDFFSERSRWGAALAYRENSSREEAAEDTGDFATESIVTTQSIAPYYSYTLTEKDSISLNGSYTKREYSASNGNFNDNDSWAMSANWQHMLTERFSAGLSISGSLYESEGKLISSKNDNYAVSATMSYAISEAWQFSGALGVNKLTSQQDDNLNPIQKTSTNGSVFNFSLNRQTELGSLDFGISRNLSGNSSGQVNEQDKAEFSFTRKLNENLSTSMTLSYQTATVQFDKDNQERENISFMPSLQWTLSPSSVLKFQYRYRQQKRSALDIVDNQNTSSNSIMATFIYNWDGYRVSR